ncbi:response regulator [Glaciimonas immobilis]|nr:response regulator [Glaciimonas immobilis]
MPPANADILVVEDEPKMAELLQTYLTAAGYGSRWISDGREALPEVRKKLPDLILLDIMLPGCDGWEICQSLRRFSAVPILMLSARVEQEDRLRGLELGADDYICKTPFSPREIVARVKAMLRRSQSDSFSADPNFSIDGNSGQKTQGIVIDEDRHQASVNGIVLNLTPLEFRLIAIFNAAPGRVFSRDQLLNHLHDEYRSVTDRAIDSHIKNLRRKFEPFFPDKSIIHAIYGTGYKFVVLDSD